MELNLDPETTHRLNFAARVMNCSPADVVRRLVDSWSEGSVDVPADPDSGPAIFAVYAGTRVEGHFNPATRGVRLTTPPWERQDFKSPSAAASAVISVLNPDRSANSNGWSFWKLAANGHELKSVRDRH